MVLPWGPKTVITQVVDTLLHCELNPLVVVTGGAQQAVQQALAGYDVLVNHNSQYATTEMMDSLRIGLLALPETTEAVLVALGDQPQIEGSVVAAIIDRYQANRSQIIVPSFQMRRGHPWLIGRQYWDEILAMNPDQSMRHFMSAHTVDIDYLVVDTPSVLGDLDTPEDYANARPASR